MIQNAIMPNTWNQCAQLQNAYATQTPPLMCYNAGIKGIKLHRKNRDTRKRRKGANPTYIFLPLRRGSPVVATAISTFAGMTTDGIGMLFFGAGATTLLP